MTDEPIEPISPPRPGAKPGSGHTAGLTMTGSTPPGNPFLTPRRSIPPEIRAIPARTPGFAPRQRSSSAEHAALRPAAGFEPPQQASPPQTSPQQSLSHQAPPRQAPSQQAPQQQQAPPQQPPPLYQEPPVQELPIHDLHRASSDPLESEPAPEFSRRRNNLVIGASAAAAVAVAIGAISLTHKSAPSTNASTGEKFSAAFGPGANDPTQAPHNNGEPLDGSTSALANQASNTTTTSPADPPPAIALPPKPPQTPATPKPPPPKPAAVCTGWRTTHIPAQDGNGNAAGTSTLHTGPYATCATVGTTFSTGQHMYIWCHATNAYGATWVYGRMDSTSAPGWQAVTALKAAAKLGPVC